MALQIGQPAPDFTLYDSDKNEISLSNYRGKTVLLLFFPLAFSRVCTSELCTVRDNMSIYNDTNAVIMGISLDSLYVLANLSPTTFARSDSGDGGPERHAGQFF